MSVSAIDVRRGQAYYYNDGIWIIISNEKIAKGKGRSYQILVMKNIKTGQNIKERFRTEEQLEPVVVDRRPMEYLYSNTGSHVFMDPETYDQVEIPLELLGDQAVYLVANITLEIAFVEGQAVTAELPNFVELKVVDTSPQVKGATATNQMKEAVCEGGARVKVPPFVENGGIIKVDTRNGEYLGRA